MTVRLESTIKRYIGLSIDRKPDGLDATGKFISGNLPPGSSFMETDTGRIYRWDGAAWTYAIGIDESASTLDEILTVLKKVCETHEAYVHAIT